MNSQLYQPATILQYVAILAAIYVFLNGPFSGNSQTQSSSDESYDMPLSQEKAEQLVYPEANLQCDHHPYGVHIFSRSPLIIYVPHFLSQAELKHMIDISEDKWEPSTIYSNNVEASDTSIRKSDKAMIERDNTVQCIEKRALDFQGWPVDTFIERFWTQRYTTSGHYAHHYDWAFASKTAHRVSTFMVYIEANCTGGGTNFPLLTRPKDKRWCEFIDCNEPEQNGVTFLPKAGGAVFWENFDVDGKGWKQGLHAGMPVHSGVKIGLNIWSWYQKGHQAVVGGDAPKDEI
ncbi:hypothetical protein M438DRAFT_408581 [Aureobasidium pullulans EXF-150]|uniref:Prolyl 4-hydroxylase alpha subunit domain-containing protein n=1 Tax=Aureobasidium pullulans EXF-150 TaxID=1043002 RepID=A0A074X5H4_AURPU|nr:uncharacterized protein M438DRAFT_408581 [Aureobasidium pullulans EXF-150]KEQ80750.1 hypothetical protein M438DRAFT_408581 [Aureobasidium pullulans EXF-150]